MQNLHESRSLSELFADSLSELSKLLQNEFDLIRVEFLQKLAVAGAAAKIIAAGAVLMIPALVLFLFGVAAELIQLGVAPPLSYAGTGLVAGTIGAGLIWMGLARLSGTALRPTATLNEILRDKAVAKELLK